MLNNRGRLRHYCKVALLVCDRQFDAGYWPRGVAEERSVGAAWIYTENIITVSVSHVGARRRCFGKSAGVRTTHLGRVYCVNAHKSAIFRTRRHDLLAPPSASICTHPSYLLSRAGGPPDTYNSMTPAGRTRPPNSSHYLFQLPFQGLTAKYVRAVL